MAGRSRGKSRKVVPLAESNLNAAGAPRSYSITPEEVSMGKQRPVRTEQANGANTPTDLPCPVVKDHDADKAFKAKQIIEVLETAVEARKETIKAIAAAQLTAIHSTLDRLLEAIPEAEQNMPLSEYLKKHCPNLVARQREDGTIRLERVSPAAASEDSYPSYCTPAFGMKPQVCAGEELSWTEYEAKLRALGHIDGLSPSAGAISIQDSAMGSFTGLSRGVTSATKTRNPREGEVLVSLNGSPLGRFTPGPSFNNVTSIRRSSRKVTRSAIKDSIRKL
ncbi:hypothetical protein R1sor_001475 [Riccia sorocarpa]|uniref:Borealin N-terminal domain-containing protein n=1 Tax=Riccia sorocarpa TaxID=122646 RepID=A0ABD3GWX4_9MARC